MRRIERFHDSLHFDRLDVSRIVEAQLNGIIETYTLTTMSTMNARRNPNVCLWCGKTQSIDHNCEIVPDYDCWFAFGEEGEGIAFVKVSRYGLQNVEDDVVCHYSAHNLFDEVSEPSTLNRKADEVEMDAHQVYDDISVPILSLIEEIPNPSSCITQFEDTLLLPGIKILAKPSQMYDEPELVETALSSDESQVIMINNEATKGCENHVCQVEVKCQGVLQDSTLDFGAYNMFDEMPEPNSKVMSFEPQGMIGNTLTQILLSFSEVENESLICDKKDMEFETLTWNMFGSICYCILIFDPGACCTSVRCDLPKANQKRTNNLSICNKICELDIKECMWELTIERRGDCIIAIFEHYDYVQLIWLKAFDTYGIPHFIAHILPLMLGYLLSSRFSSNFTMKLLYVTVGIQLDSPFCKFGCLFVFSDTRIIGLLIPFYILTLEDKGKFRGEGDKIYEKYIRERFIVVVSWHTECHKGTYNFDGDCLKVVPEIVLDGLNGEIGTCPEYVSDFVVCLLIEATYVKQALDLGDMFPYGIYALCCDVNPFSSTKLKLLGVLYFIHTSRLLKFGTSSKLVKKQERILQRFQSNEGSLLIGRTEAEVDQLKRRIQQLSAAGIRADYLSTNDLLTMEPKLEVDQQSGAAFLPDDCQSEGKGNIEGMKTKLYTLYGDKAIIIAAGGWSGYLMDKLLKDSIIVLLVHVKARKGRLIVLENFNPLGLTHDLMGVGLITSVLHLIVLEKDLQVYVFDPGGRYMTACSYLAVRLSLTKWILEDKDRFMGWVMIQSEILARGSLVILRLFLITQGT